MSDYEMLHKASETNKAGAPGETKPAEINKFDKSLDYLTGIVGILMVVLHMYYAYTWRIQSIIILNAHLGFSLVMVYLTSARKTKNPVSKFLLLLCLLASVLCVLYVHFNSDALQDRIWANTNLDLVVGVILIAVVIIAVKLGFGWFMPILIMAITLYPFFGKYLPQPFTTRAYPFDQTIANFSIGLNTGLYSGNLRTSVEYVFLFVVFGSVLSATGVQKFFWELGKMLFRNLRSGPGLMAVLNSCLVGSVTGSPVANVMITGVYTIPSMKAAGYRPEDAAAMEASASNGGQIMPPVMGTAAFIMASYTGIPYLRIIAMAIIPALLYYLSVGLSAYFIVFKKNIQTENLDFFKEKTDLRLFFWKMPGFVIPLVTMVVLLANNMSVMTTAFWSILCLIAVSLLTPKDIRPKVKDILKGLISGAKEGATLGIILSAIGLILITFSSTGLAVKIGGGIMSLTGGKMILILLVVWVMCILFGMIGVISAAYYMGAIFAASTLTNLGLPLETVHFFIILPCMFAAITPPVAMACVVAAKLAGADYIKTAAATVRTAFIAFFLPFLVVYAPAITLSRSPKEGLFWVEIITSILIVLCGQFSFVGYFLTNMNILERLLLGAGALLFFISLMFVNYIPVVPWSMALASVAVFLFLHIKKYLAVKKGQLSLQPSTLER